MKKPILSSKTINPGIPLQSSSIPQVIWKPFQLVRPDWTCKTINPGEPLSTHACMKKKIAKRLLTLVNKLKNEGRDQLNGIKYALKISIILSKRAKHRFRGELPHQFAYNFYSRPLHTSSQNFKRSSLRHQTIFDFMQLQTLTILYH